MRDFIRKEDKDVKIKVPIRRSKESKRCAIFMNMPEYPVTKLTSTYSLDRTAETSSKRLAQGLEGMITNDPIRSAHSINRSYDVQMARMSDAAIEQIQEGVRLALGGKTYYRKPGYKKR